MLPLDVVSRIERTCSRVGAWLYRFMVVVGSVRQATGDRRLGGVGTDGIHAKGIGRTRGGTGAVDGIGWR